MGKSLPFVRRLKFRPLSRHMGENMKPRVFIASSTQAIPYAEALQEALAPNAEVTGWTDAVFDPSKFFLETLLERLGTTDFAIFVFHPEDVTRVNGTEYKAVRDNVLFELGLFMGKLGRDRCFILQPQEAEQLRIASDLAGLAAIKFDSKRSDENLVAAMRAAAGPVRRSLEKLGRTSSTDTSSLPPGFSNGSAIWLTEHLDEIRRKIVNRSIELASLADSKVVRPAEVARAASQFAPGGPVRGSNWFVERVLSSLSGITVVAALLAVIFGWLGIYTGQAVYFDIVKLFAGTVLGSAGASVVARRTDA